MSAVGKVIDIYEREGRNHTMPVLFVMFEIVQGLQHKRLIQTVQDTFKVSCEVSGYDNYEWVQAMITPLVQQQSILARFNLKAVVKPFYQFKNNADLEATLVKVEWARANGKRIDIYHNHRRT